MRAEVFSQEEDLAWGACNGPVVDMAAVAGDIASQMSFQRLVLQFLAYK